jgi:hypothetical protein
MLNKQCISFESQLTHCSFSKMNLRLTMWLFVVLVPCTANEIQISISFLWHKTTITTSLSIMSTDDNTLPPVIVDMTSEPDAPSLKEVKRVQASMFSFGKKIDGPAPAMQPLKASVNYCAKPAVVVKNPVGRPRVDKGKYASHIHKAVVITQQLESTPEEPCEASRPGKRKSDDKVVNTVFRYGNDPSGACVMETKTKAVYQTWTDEMNLILCNLCHIWSKDDKHIGWRKGNEVIERLRAAFGHKAIVEKTVRNKITAEKENPSLTAPPDLTAAFKSVNEKKKVVEEPPQWNRTGRNFTFSPTLYDKKLAEHVEKLKGYAGFGMRTVKISAIYLYKKTEPELYAMNGWTPSNAWCYWFLTGHMKYSLRKVTGSGREDNLFTEKQRRLFQNLKERLALDILEGTPPCMIIGE